MAHRSDPYRFAFEDVLEKLIGAATSLDRPTGEFEGVELCWITPAIPFSEVDRSLRCDEPETGPVHSFDLIVRLKRCLVIDKGGHAWTRLRPYHVSPIAKAVNVMLGSHWAAAGPSQLA